MVKRTGLLIYFVLFVVFATAQKKEISQAKQWIKKGTNLEQAQKSMLDLLKDSTHRRNEKVWLTLYDAYKKQYDLGNEKLYLKQTYDTTQLFKTTLQLFLTLEGLDSVCISLQTNEQEKPKYREKHAELLNDYRANLYRGGLFFIHKRTYSEAYQLLDAYINCAEQPLFGRYHYRSTDPLLPEAAYWSVYCGYKMQDTQATFRHASLALKDTAHYVYMLQYLAEAYQKEKNMVQYELALKNGFDSFPDFPFFFPRLISYYTENERFEEALQITNTALQRDSTNERYLFAKSSLLFNLKDYDQCISISKKLLAANDTLADVYLNIGLSYYNKGVNLDKDVKSSAKYHQKIVDYYASALGYLERYRTLRPDEKDRWGFPLYTIYLNLNMGKAFDEIDKILRTK